MEAEQKNYTLKVFDLNSNNITEHNLKVESGLHKTNGNVIWNIQFDFQGEKIESENQHLLSQSINKIREIIEPKGFRILVKCSDYDAAHSGMQADMTAGTMIYKMNELNEKGSPVSYDILAESDIHSVVSLSEQNKNREDAIQEMKMAYNKTMLKEKQKWWQKFFKGLT